MVVNRPKRCYSFSMNNKKCHSCELMKEIEEFQNRSTSRLFKNCKLCREFNRSATMGGSHPEEMKRQAWRSHLKNTYGITTEEYDRMLAEQGGSCAICDREPKKRRLSVDHDHSTGKVRGLLCTPCRSSIVYFANRLNLIKEYISKHKED